MQLHLYVRCPFLDFGSLLTAVLHFAVSHHDQSVRLPSCPAVHQSQADQLLSAFKSWHGTQCTPLVVTHA